MMLAERHGKVLEAARDNEDYLTSAVFGHLRYVPTGPFWDDFLKRARGLPGPNDQGPSLGETLQHAGMSPSKYSQVKVYFWKEHPKHGEADLILVFTGGGIPPLVVLVEVKLWSPKSGTGKDDQLVRYLRLLEDLTAVDVLVPAEAAKFLVYLTPRESLREVQESADLVDDPDRDRPRLFRLQWQDVLEAAKETSKNHEEPFQTILSDVTEFLHKVGLDYFKGFRRDEGLPMIDVRPAPFSTVGPIRFQGFRRDSELPLIEKKKTGWA
jgi:hypothetical protein